MIHASSTVDEAEYEIAHWFSGDPLVNYKRTDEDVLF